MTMIRRQAASCLYGLVPMLRQILTRRLDELDVIAVDGEDAEIAGALTPKFEALIAGVLKQGESLDPDDPKFNALLGVVLEKLTMPNRRVIIFSSFRHTLGYLFDGLDRAGVRIGVVHGGIADDERMEMRRRFALDAMNTDALDVLLFSEVGSEGLDYQFCDCIVNYDLPWNPMRIEQRIGRVDRRGQASETVRIVNIITPGTVDADIYSRCLLRIGIFERELGASDDILGRLTRELRSIAEDLTLSDDERRDKLQQLADNEVRLIRAQQELEDRQAEFFALRVPAQSAAEDLQSASSRWLSAPMIENLARNYLASRGASDDCIQGERQVKTLRLNQELRNILLKDLSRLTRSTSSLYREWESWLKGTIPHARITFDPKAASENRDAVLLSPVHPLIRQAAESYKLAGRFMAGFLVKTSAVPAGDYPFAVYQWRFLGLQEDLQLHPVLADETVQEQFLDIIASAEPLSVGPEALPSQDILDALETAHYAAWERSRKQHREATASRAAFRLASLASSHNARLSLLGDQLARAKDERIKRMHKSQMERASRDNERRVHDIKTGIESSDLQAQAVAFGLMRVVK
jgi:hypothetical protein